MSTQTVRKEIHKNSIYGRAAIQKPFISDDKDRNWKNWYIRHKAWIIEQWKPVIYSDES